MNRITRTITELQDRGEAAFMPFLVIGDPDIEISLRLTEALVDAGADLLEFGFPFSDPPADGPVIQAADVRALQAGTTPDRCFAFLDEVKTRWDKPVALLIYYNLVLQHGVEAFYERAAAAGVDGVLVADVPIEESPPLVQAARAAGVAPVFIASGLTTDDRLAMLGERGDGFLYAVARVGITGVRSEVSGTLAAEIGRFKRHVGLPVVAGFGISTPAHVRAALAAGADGVITGSALVKKIEENLGHTERMIAQVGELARTLKAATRETGDY